MSAARTRGRGANWFVALPVASGAWFEALAAPGPFVRRFHPDDLHATVAFLGPVGAERARAAFEEARRWPLGPLRARLLDVRPMGNPARASALSAMLETEDDADHRALLEALAHGRDALLERAGVRPDRRAPLPHVTLARIQRRATARERRHALQWAAGLELGSPRVRLERLALYTWSEDRRERQFRIVDELSLPVSSD